MTFIPISSYDSSKFLKIQFDTVLSTPCKKYWGMDGLTFMIKRVFFDFVDQGCPCDIHDTLQVAWLPLSAPLRAKTNRFQKFLSRSDSTNEPEGGKGNGTHDINDIRVVRLRGLGFDDSLLRMGFQETVDSTWKNRRRWRRRALDAARD